MEFCGREEKLTSFLGQTSTFSFEGFGLLFGIWGQNEPAGC